MKKFNKHKLCFVIAGHYRTQSPKVSKRLAKNKRNIHPRNEYMGETVDGEFGPLVNLYLF